MCWFVKLCGYTLGSLLEVVLFVPVHLVPDALVLLEIEDRNRVEVGTRWSEDDEDNPKKEHKSTQNQKEYPTLFKALIELRLLFICLCIET